VTIELPLNFNSACASKTVVAVATMDLPDQATSSRRDNGLNMID